MKQTSKKLTAGVSEEFADSLNNCTIDELKAKVVQLQVQVEENNAFKETQGYTDALTAYQLVVGPVRETARSLKNRTKMVIERLKEKGGC